MRHWSSLKAGSLVALLAAFLAGCGDDGGGNSAPAMSLAAPAGPQSGDVVLTYSLSDADGDPCSIEVQYQGGSAGSTWTTTTLQGATTGIIPGAGLTVTWSSGTDEAGELASDYKIRIRAHDGKESGSWSETGSFAVDNNAAPSVSLATPSGTQSGDVVLTYDLSDADGHSCDIEVQYEGGTVGTTWTTASTAGGLTGISPGTGLTVTWSSATDEAGELASDYKVRARAYDGREYSSWSETASFTADNNAAPSVSLATPSGAQSGNVVLTYDLSDADGHSCDIEVQYQGGTVGTTWTTASTTGGLTGVSPGTGLTVTWSSDADQAGESASDYAVRVRAYDGREYSPWSETTSFTVDNNSAPGLVVQTPSGTQAGDVSLSYDLVDADSHSCDIEAESQGGSVGSTWTVATLTGTVTGVAPGTGLTVGWSSATDEPGQSASDYRVRLRADDGREQGDWSSTLVFTVDNGGANAKPGVNVYEPGAPQSGDATITYDLADLDGDACDIEVQYQGGSVGTTWTIASVAGTVTNLTPASGLTIIWTSAADESGELASDYKVRIRAHDGTEYGAWFESTAFAVDNNTEPEIVVQTPSGTGSGDVAITYDLADADGDSCSIEVQYKGGSAGDTWRTATVSGTVMGIAPAMGLTIVWESGTDEPAEASSDYRIRIRAHDGKEQGGWDASLVFSVDNGGSNWKPGINVYTPTGFQAGDVSIQYDLFDLDGDLCDVWIEYRGGSVGTTWTMAFSSLPNIAPGTGLTIVWGSTNDEPIGTVADYQIRLRPHDGTEYGNWAESGYFTVDNDPIPEVTVETPAGTQTGYVTLSYTLRDNDSDACDIEVLYSTDGGNTYQAGTEGPDSDGMFGLSSSPTGVTHTFVWDSLNDLACGAFDVVLRVVATDVYGSSGPANTASFYVLQQNVSDGLAGEARKCDIAVDGNGVVHCVWANGSGSNGLYYASSADGGATWSSPLALAPSVPDASGRRNLAICVDGDNRPHILYAVGTVVALPYELRHIWHNGSAWTAPVIVDSSATRHVDEPKLATDAAGLVHLVYGNFTEVRYRTFNGASWSSALQIFDAGAAGGANLLPDMCIDLATSIVHFVWIDRNLAPYAVRYRNLDGGTLSSIETLSNISNAYEARVCHTTAGVLVVWSQGTSTNYHKYGQFHDGTSWGSVQWISQDVATGNRLNTTVDSDAIGNAVLVWPVFNGDTDVYHKTWNGSAWSAATEVSNNSGGSGSGLWGLSVDAHDGSLYFLWSDASISVLDLFFTVRP